MIRIHTINTSYLIFIFLQEHSQARIISNSPVHSTATAIPKRVTTIRTFPCLTEEGCVLVTATEQLVVFMRIPHSAEALSEAAIVEAAPKSIKR